MTDLEAMARAIARKICEAHPREGDNVNAWINEHWELVAAQYEAGLIDDTGQRTEKYSDEKAFAAVEAWHERRATEKHLTAALHHIFGRLNKELT